MKRGKVKLTVDKNPIDYSQKWWARLVFFGSVFFLFLPLFAIVFFSFNNSRRITVWEGFTWNNYGKVMQNSALIEAFVNSLLVGIIASFVSLILGVFSSYVLRFFHFRFQSIYRGLLSIPIVIPEICMGLALLIFFNQVFGSLNIGAPWPFNLILVICAHITFCFPFVALVIESRLKLLNMEWVEAAADLGANEFQIFKDIVLPYLKPALISGFLLSLTLSLDDFIITFFTSGPETITFPVKVYSMLRFSVTPEVNAASSILIFFTILLTIISAFLQKKSNPKNT